MGSWDTGGRHSTDWTRHLMREALGPDGSIVFEAEVSLAASEVGKEFHWRVVLDGPLGLDRQGIVTEQHGLGHDALHRTFTFAGDPRAEQRYYLTHVRRDEFNHALPVPNRIEDMVIYELHVGSLGFGLDRPGNLDDAMELLDYLTELGINAIELLPIAEASGNRTWGYGNSHHFAVESSAGGRDKFRQFVRACHQRGIAVIVDVVYNHYVPDGERAQWQYDSDREENNIYYWYEGHPSDYPTPDGGYVDNMSTGFAPRFHDEMVRKLFISSAAALVIGFHVDGFRVDQTTSIHAYNVIHADGRAAAEVNVAGAKFLRELSRTLRLIRPATLLTCEDHSDWVLVTEPPDGAGLGFDATWYSNFYHQLIGSLQIACRLRRRIARTACLGVRR